MINALIFLGVYFLFVILTFLLNPVYSFILYEAVYFFNPAVNWWTLFLPSLPYSFISVILMLVAFIWKQQGRHQSINKLLSAPPLKWIYLLLILYAITWLYSVYPDRHLNATINYMKLIVIISIAYKLIDTSRNLNLVLLGYIFGSWYISFLVFQTGRNAGDRVEGVGTLDAPDTNGVAAAIAPTLVLCLYYLWISENKLIKLFVAFSAIFIANALILINSRGGFLAVGASISYFMFYMYFSSFQRKNQKAFAVGISIIGILGLLFLIDDSFIERFKSIQNTEITEEQQSGSTRVLFWMAAWDMAKDYPLGSGYRSFDYYSDVYVSENVDMGFSRSRSVHSTWFEILSEIGYLGLLLFLILIYSCFKATRRCVSTLKEKGDVENYYKIIALEAAFLSFIITMTFLNRFRAEILYWLILYCACAYNIYVVKSSDNAPEKINPKHKKFA